MSVEEICRQHLYLTPTEAHAAIGYYFDHQKEIDQEIKEEWDQVQGSINLSDRLLYQDESARSSVNREGMNKFEYISFK